MKLNFVFLSNATYPLSPGEFVPFFSLPYRYLPPISVKLIGLFMHEAELWRSIKNTIGTFSTFYQSAISFPIFFLRRF